MGRIGASLTGIERTLLNKLSRANAAANVNLLRLATGKKINSPRDNPHGFIALSGFQSRIKVVQSTLANAASASGLVSQAQLTLDQIRTELNTIRNKALEDENQQLTPAQRIANQAAIDSAILEIGQLASTDFGGRRLLDGSADFTVSGANPSQVKGVHANSVSGPGQIIAARQAELVHNGSGGAIAANAEIQIEGNLGNTSISLTAGQTLQEVVRRVNGRSATTGVVAEASGDVLRFHSQATGNDSYVEITVESGTFAVAGGNGNGLAYGRTAQFGAEAAVAGFVESAATQATLVYSGAGGNVTADATFNLTGDRGTAAISVSAAGPDTLVEAADRVNLESHLTGVVAEVSGDDLTFRSIDYGREAIVQVQVTSGTFAVTGGNGDGTANGTNAVATINGLKFTGNSAAANAELIYSGIGGQITDDANFTLRGSLGNFNFAVSQSDNLSTVRDAVNAQQATTGVQAAVVGNDLVLTSSQPGKEQFVELEITSGTFEVFSENGLNYSARVPAAPAELIYTSSGFTIEGNTTFDLTGTGTQSISLSAGQTLFDARNFINGFVGTTGVAASVDGQQLILTSVGTGDSAQVQVDVTSGTFDVTGGNGDGTANGVNALSRVHGKDAVTNDFSVRGNRVFFRNGGYDVEIEFAAGFAGGFDAITIKDDALRFALSTDVFRTSVLPIRNLAPSVLGGQSGTLDQLSTGGQFAGLNTNAPRAIRIVDEALGILDVVDGLVDGFASQSIASATSLFSALETSLTESIAAIDAIDEEEESLQLAKNQLLIANAQTALEIIALQRNSFVDLVRRAAGLTS